MATKKEVHKLTALVNVPGELYGKPGERTNTGDTFEVATKAEADAIKKGGYAEDAK